MFEIPAIHKCRQDKNCLQEGLVIPSPIREKEEKIKKCGHLVNCNTLLQKYLVNVKLLYDDLIKNRLIEKSNQFI
jgi:hypothetical protein